jgi:type IV pilus assembly protein PilW
MTQITNKKGFTLIEILVALAISSVVMTAIYSSYRNQVSSHTTQQRIVDMQQNIRGGLTLMEREIRMAGYDPTENAGARITLANRAELTMQMDINENGSTAQIGTPNENPNEIVRYVLNNDANKDGIADGTPCHLGRDTGGGRQPAADNIDALNFVYLDASGNVLATPVTRPNQIRTIQVTMVAREGTRVPVLSYITTDNRTYQNQQGQVVLPAQNDNFRRIILTSNIYCRNMVHLR